MRTRTRERTAESETAPGAEGRVVDEQSTRPALSPMGMVLGLLAAAGWLLAAFLPWRDPGIDAADVPLEFLWNRDAGFSHPSLLVLVVPVAVALGIGAVVPRGAGLRLVASLVGAVGITLFAVQTYRLVDNEGGSSLFDALGRGFFLATVGTIVGVVSGLVPGGWKSRHERRWQGADADRFWERDRH